MHWEALTSQVEERSVYRAARSRVGFDDFDALVVVLAGLHTVFWLPVFVTDVVPRTALAIGLLPLGLGLAIASARRRQPAAVAALLCVAVFVVAGLLAEAPVTAFVGQLPEWLSVVALSATLGWWAIGRELSPIGGRLMAYAVTVGTAANGLVGIAQLAFHVEAGRFAARAGRASGLLLNPVFYGTLTIGVAGYWVARASENHSRQRVLLVGMLTFMAALSGGRAVLGAAVGTWLVCIMLWRRRALRAVAGGAAAYVFAEVFVRIVAPSTSSVERLSDGTTGGRLQFWRASLEAVAERPLLGWGPANAELAIMRNLPLSYVEDVHPDGTWSIMWDPHNAVLTVLLSVGLFGAAALAGFLVLSLRGVKEWPYLVAVVAMALTWSLQPFTVHTLPLAALLLGAGVRPKAKVHASDDASVAPDVGETTGMARWQVGCLGAGAAVAAFVLATTFVIDRAVARNDLDRAHSAIRFMPGDPWLHLYLAEANEAAYARGTGSSRSLDVVREQVERAADLYPSSEHYERVADASVAQGDYRAAGRALERAVALEPWSPYAHIRLLAVSIHLGDEAGVEKSGTALCSMSEYWCEAVRARTESSASSEVVGG